MVTNPLSIYAIVDNRRELRAGATLKQPHVVPGWLVVGLFVMSDAGEPTCVDYRVRAIPNTRAMGEWHGLVKQITASMMGDYATLPPANPTPGGVPRYVFEEASQMRLLTGGRRTVKRAARRGRQVDARVKAMLAAADQRKPGRPPVRSLPEKLRVLAEVEIAYEVGESLDRVAHKSAMSRSALRDLLTWARHDADPPLFTSLGPGRRGGRLTPEARALLDEIGDDDGQRG